MANYYDEFAQLPSHESLARLRYGHGYPSVDALVLYAMLRDLKPKRYLEVGSGMSTYYCSLACQKNASEGHRTAITCVEPFPFKSLGEIEGIRLIKSLVQDVGLDDFRELESGDVLFIDSSHILRLDGDVPFLYLEVLPLLKQGVHVHIHDIPFPYNCPHPAEYWVLTQGRTANHWPVYWNEPMVLQAFFAFNPDFEIELSCPLLRHFDEPFLRKTVPIPKHRRGI
jgi:hypothetical protein